MYYICVWRNVVRLLVPDVPIQQRDGRRGSGGGGGGRRSSSPPSHFCTMQGKN